MYLTASNQNCLWNLLISWMDTCWTPHLGPWDYEERMCISKSFQQPCALSGDEGWVCIMIIERKKSILTWFQITCEKKSKVQSQRHHSWTWLKDYRCRKPKLGSFSYLVTSLVLTESKIADISRHAMDPIETYLNWLAHWVWEYAREYEQLHLKMRREKNLNCYGESTKENKGVEFKLRKLNQKSYSSRQKWRKTYTFTVYYSFAQWQNAYSISSYLHSTLLTLK